ncbi:MAG: peptidylprolyl isomerase [Clostridia bacterium]|nr:peptidylprolyl isomerase [Clostridia bacterium]
MADGGKIVIELYPEVAPNTVCNFIELANSGFYDGLTFHRCIAGFMIQSGDPEGTGMGGPGYTIKGEFTSNGFTNTLKHERGVISMARKSVPLDSAGSQFFIMVEDATHLDGQYAAFGKVTEGMDIVDKIVANETDENDKPLVDQVIKSIKVNTKGVKYPESQKIK